MNLEAYKYKYHWKCSWLSHICLYISFLTIIREGSMWRSWYLWTPSNNDIRRRKYTEHITEATKRKQNAPLWKAAQAAKMRQKLKLPAKRRRLNCAEMRQIPIWRAKQWRSALTMAAAMAASSDLYTFCETLKTTLAINETGANEET